MSLGPNPILSGFSPDPSICRVGDTYYLATSTFAYFPGVPIYRSQDLRTWEMIGHCLTREEQLPLYGADSSAGIYAPTLRYREGKFYMIVSNMSHMGTFLVTSERPEGPWSDPVVLDKMTFDPSIFWDDDGTCYLTGADGGWIHHTVLDPETGKLGESRRVWQGSGGQCPEGPHLFKREGTYYLTIAEGGTEYGHMQTIARAHSPFGPYEACPRNPILTHRSKWSPIHAAAHADFFQDGAGDWWLVALGIRPNGYPPTHHLGRETFLARVRWDDEGWPVVGAEGMFEPGEAAPQPPDRECFRSNGPGLEWVYLRNPDPSRYEFGHGLRLKGSSTGLDAEASATWIGRRQRHFNVRFATLVEPALRDNDEAGLSVRMNERHRYELALRKGEVFVRRTIGSLSAITATRPTPEGPVRLWVEAEPDTYRFYAEIDGEPVLIDTAETRYLATEVAGGFTGVMLGLYAVSPSGNGGASFAWCDYDALEKPEKSL